MSIPGLKKLEQSDEVAFLDFIRISDDKGLWICWVSMKCKVVFPDSIFMSSTGCHEPFNTTSNAILKQE
jgi:hypothetical protein